MKVEVGAATDVGKVREGNEDGYLVSDPLFVVADGMGGHRGGEVASGLALQTIEELRGKRKGSLAEQVQEANRTVFERSSNDRTVEGMGTTLTAALVDRDTLQLAHVGDSRAYLLRAGTLRLLTEDHTLVERMVRSGEITREEADVHPHRNVLTRSLGTDRSVSVDEQSVTLLEGDRVLLCTDGLTGMATDEQIKAILGSASTAQDAADRLVRAANRAGGADNITVIVLDVVAGEPAGGAAGSGVSRGGASSGRHNAGTWIRLGVIAALVVVAGLVIAKTWIDRQWYVGESSGRVAVFQGIPARVAGFRLSQVVEIERDIPATKAQQLPLFTDLPSGITTSSRTAAEQIVRTIRVQVGGATSNGSGGSGGSGVAGSGGGVSTKPSASLSGSVPASPSSASSGAASP
jgi:serine/threonine protein phosphatase PrpC